MTKKIRVVGRRHKNVSHREVARALGAEPMSSKEAAEFVARVHNAKPKSKDQGIAQ